MIPELTPEEWLEEAIKDSFIIKYELSEFSGIEVVGTGATGLVHRAFLRKLQNHVALKSFEFSKKFTNKEFVNEVNFVSTNKHYRETPVKGSPRKYVQLYQRCWENDPKNRPDAKKVLDTLINFTEQDYEDVIDSCRAPSTYKHLELSSIKFDDELTDRLPYPIYAENTGILSDNSPTPSITLSSPRKSLSSFSSDESESLRSPVPDNNNIGHINNFPTLYPYDDGQFNMNDFIDQMKYEARRFNNMLLNRFIYLTTIKEDVGIIIEDLKKTMLLTRRNPELVYKSLQEDFSRYSCLIGFFDEFGIGTEINELKALRIYLQESQSHEPISVIPQLYLVRFLEKNSHDEEGNKDQNVKPQSQWFARITLLMYGDAYLEYAKQLDKRKIFGLFEEFAKKGNNWGLYSVAWCYLRGIGVDKNEKEALRIFLEAAYKQNSLSQFQLSMLYAKGIGTNVNIPEAEKWIKQAEEQNDPISTPYIQKFISVISNNN
ncbi:3156_t:CDS:2 [Entrophospora sp. SA101]|nr:3156_t:CDS:2 [Entrophospora sp. SA101]